MKKWITFDLDGTLMQNPFGLGVFPEIKRQVYAENPDIDVLAEMLEVHEQRLAHEENDQAYDWDGILDKVLKAHHLDLNLNVLDLVIQHCKPPYIALLEEEVPEILKELQHLGYSLAVITNGYYNYQFPVMKALNISDYFEAIITPEQVGHAKPHPGMADKLIAKGTLVAHVGDRVDHDVVFANQLGAMSILISRSNAKTAETFADRETLTTPKCVISSLAELPQLLQC